MLFLFPLRGEGKAHAAAVISTSHDHLLTGRKWIPTIALTAMEQIMPGKSSVSRREFDIVIIGAGVIGCAMARRFTLEGAKVILIERAADILAGASKGNSAILHTGFDAEPQSLELKCMQDGYEEYQSIRQRLGLPLLETGAMVIAWSEDELARLEPIFETAKANGVGDVELLQPGRIYARESQLARGALGAVLVPREHIIDPWSAPLAYLGQAVDHGAEIRRNTELKAAQFRNGAWQLETTSGPLAAHWLINCAGLFGDKVEELALGQSSFTIKPRKGQFIVLDKAAAASLRTTLLPVPNERTKGIVLCRTIFGNVLVGPTAEEILYRGYAMDRIEALTGRIWLAGAISTIVFGLAHAPFWGLGPALTTAVAGAVLAAGGIRSTGLTAALGIARHVFDLYRAAGNPHVPVAKPRWPQVPNLADHQMRDFARPGHGEIVCHCESVTRREIERALQGALAAKDIGGLKRRTRAMMGRCQGFYCSAAVAAIADEHLAVALATGSTHDER